MTSNKLRDQKGGGIATSFVAASKPDGYTLLSTASGSFLLLPLVAADTPYKVSDLVAVGKGAYCPFLIVANKDVPAKNLKELVDYVKKNPGALSIGFGGAQWSMEVTKSLMKKEGLKFKLAMFKTRGEASTALLGGHIDLVETGSGTPAYQAAREGKLIPVVNLGLSRDPHFPQLKYNVDLGNPWSARSKKDLRSRRRCSRMRCNTCGT